MQEVIFVTCVFGTRFRRLHRALPGERNILFTNRTDLRGEAKRKGWEYRFVRRFGKTSDYREASLQSKYVKFLNFLHDFPEFQQASTIVYLDHKVVISAAEAHRLMRKMQREKSIFMISSRKGWTVRDEVGSGMRQERYRISMKETVEWIDDLVARGEARWEGQVYSTTLMIYRDPMSFLLFLDKLYLTLLELKQPECQIIWGVLAQQVEESIQHAYWEDVCVTRSEPLPFFRHIIRATKSKLRSIRRQLSLARTL